MSQRGSVQEAFRGVAGPPLRAMRAAAVKLPRLKDSLFHYGRFQRRPDLWRTIDGDRHTSVVGAAVDAKKWMFRLAGAALR